MKYNICLFCCLLSFTSLKAQKILSHNIWDGFEDAPERKELFINWVKAQNPDVMAYQELCGFTEKDLAEMAAQYGHPYVVIAKEEGYPVGLSSKEPIELIYKQIEGYWHGMLHANTYNLDFIVIHLSPFEWEYRLKEAHQLTNYIAEKQLKDYLIMGDFNSFTPFDADVIDRMTGLKERYLQSEANNPRKNMRGNKFDYSVMSCFLASGVTDICREFVPASQRGTFPTSTLYKKEWDDPEVAQRRKRIDFILVSPSLVPDCTKATIHNGRDADPLSDHYPVSVEIERN